MGRISSVSVEERERHAGPGWFATSGLACRFGHHWPATALSGEHAAWATSPCADCGRSMVRQADGGWVALPEGADTRPRSASGGATAPYR